MTHPPSRAILTAAAIVTLLNACTPPPTEPASPTPEETSMSTQQEGAPTPATSTISMTSSPSGKPPSQKVPPTSRSPRPPNSPNPTPEAGDTSSHTTQTRNPSETTSTHTPATQEMA